MRLCAITLENFRSYRDPTRIAFDDLTTIIGRNDIGKSSILEALEIFFNRVTVKIDRADKNVYSKDDLIAITVEFTELPSEITLDAGAMTSLADEYLLSSDSTLKIRQEYDCSKLKPSCETYILALHPTAPGVSNLLELKETALQSLVRRQPGLENASLKGNPGMRKALWDATDNLDLAEVRVHVSKPKEDSKRIWEQIENHLPLFVLFQSDRQSKDTDGEVQSPLNAAIKTAIGEVQEEIDAIQPRFRKSPKKSLG